MLHLYDRATMANALTLDLEPQLHRLLAQRIDSLTEDLIDITEYLVIDPILDTEADIVRHVGFSPLVDPIDGICFGEPDFHPAHDWLQDHGGYFELIVTFGSSFAYVLLIRDDVEVDHPLLLFCRRYA
ncbi:hypothetical protein LPN01_07560 [Sphingomonas sp. A2-49]|uniref:hypothetical protein n=1 Tax=Sphingomonas sp. A2-49 TaxID=1391375 RepID=UPI0021D03D9D|nr:hypothetical protein [Sphingomonas sp. A2-49]MCU6453931.1 hypothetical protein [Sphingomonas sp. A2-49]